MRHSPEDANPINAILHYCCNIALQFYKISVLRDVFVQNVPDSSWMKFGDVV